MMSNNKDKEVSLCSRGNLDDVIVTLLHIVQKNNADFWTQCIILPPGRLFSRENKILDFSSFFTWERPGKGQP